MSSGSYPRTTFIFSAFNQEPAPDSMSHCSFDLLGKCCSAGLQSPVPAVTIASGVVRQKEEVAAQRDGSKPASLTSTAISQCIEGFHKCCTADAAHELQSFQRESNLFGARAGMSTCLHLFLLKAGTLQAHGPMHSYY